MEKKITSKEMFRMIKAVIEDSEVENQEAMIEFLNKKITQLNTKGKKRAETAKQKENKALKEVVFDVLNEIETPATTSTILKAVQETGKEEFAGMSNQKMAALLKLLVNDGLVVKTKDKKVSYFSVADAENEIEEDEDEDIDE